LPTTTENFDYISALLSVAFLLFAGSLFIAIGIQYILRQDDPASLPSRAKSKVCIVHTYVVMALLVVGFVLLNVVLMNIGQKVVGIAGIALLGVIPCWYICVTFYETVGMFDDPTPRVGSEEAGLPKEISDKRV